MEKYIKQLIEDLEEVAKNPPSPIYIEPLPHLNISPDIVELALVPYKSIEELTGLKQEVFPEIDDLQGDQWERVNRAIFKVFDSLKLELVDAPPDMPPEWLYDVLSTNWHHPVQYLPSSGMDLELCTGDPMTCPYGDYCSCGEEFDEYELPEKFADFIGPITQSIYADFVCFLNPETMELEDVPKSLLDDPHELKMKTGLVFESEELVYKNWKQCYIFKPLDVAESFKMMETFAESVDDEILQAELFYVLNHKKSEKEFERAIEKSKQSDNWIYFKMDYLKDRVKFTIYSEIHKIPDDFDVNDLPF